MNIRRGAVAAPNPAAPNVEIPVGAKGGETPPLRRIAYDTALGSRYPNPLMKEMHGTHSMGETAENIAQERPHITREKQDAFSVRSHQRAIAAIDSGRFKQEIMPVSIPKKKGDPKIVDTDERPRRDTTMESLAKLKSAFAREGGTVTAGNSSGLNDGAAALLLMSEEKAKQLGYKPLARIVASASAGVPPRVMGLGPVPATKKALQRAGLQMKDIGLMPSKSSGEAIGLPGGGGPRTVVL